MMTLEYSLSLTMQQHSQLYSLLYPGDRKEAVALMLCGYRAGEQRQRLVVRDIFPVLNHWYRKRADNQVTWSTDALEPILERAESDKLTLIKVHSHPSGYPQFSVTDDNSDRSLLPLVRDWFDCERPHGSAVMLPDGQMFGRILASDAQFTPLTLISIVGDDLKFWFANAPAARHGDFCASHAQAFGEGTSAILRGLTVAVVGCSGTGSPVIEQLIRLGVKRLILVDDDVIEIRNMNRILLATMDHVNNNTAKVAALAEGIHRIGLATQIVALQANLASRKAIDAVAQADILFGCMDSIEGRYMLNRLATFYTLPYFDLGVRLVADNTSGIDEICGTVHYLQPGCSSLMSRGLFSMADVATDGLRRHDPKAYREQLADGYIRGVLEDRPAVISVNMYAASLAVNELLARLHPYREAPNADFASVEFSLVSMDIYTDSEGEPCRLLSNHVGRGDMDPRLDLIEFAEEPST